MRAADEVEKCDRIWERRAAEVAEAEREAARTAVEGNEDMSSTVEEEGEVEVVVGVEEASLTTGKRR